VRDHTEQRSKTTPLNPKLPLLFNSFHFYEWLQHGELLKPLLHQRFLEMLQHLCIFQPPRPTSGIYLLRLCREGRNRGVVTRFDSSDGTRRLGRLEDNRSYYASVSYGWRQTYAEANLHGSDVKADDFETPRIQHLDQAFPIKQLLFVRYALNDCLRNLLSLLLLKTAVWIVFVLGWVEMVA